MCGIWGKYYFDEKRSISTSLIQKMGKSLFHRGPDEGNYIIKNNVALGTQRLSILDIEKGQQPVSNEDKTIWAVFNGEIYNYKELKKYLIAKNHYFFSQCDSEVIPHLYEDYGEQFLEKLRGMFAIALWDKRKSLLMLARDRLGIKPLFFMQDKNFLIFASEIKAILHDDGVIKEIDAGGVNCYLSYNYLPSSYTIFKNIKKLLPGHYLICKRKDKVEIKKYWQIKYKNTSDSIDKIEEKFKDLLDDTIQSHLIADVSWGIFLSGGLDSSTLVHFIKHYQQNIYTFNLNFQEKSFDEGKFARYIGQFFDTTHYETIMNAQQCKRQLREIVNFLDNPIGEPSVVPTFFMANFAKNYIKVAISGEGADELFCGYPTYQADILAKYYQFLPYPVKHLASFLANKLPLTNEYLPFGYKARLFTQGAARAYSLVHYFWREIFSQEEKEELLSFDYICELKKNNLFNESLDIFFSYFNEINTSNYIEKCLYTDLKIWLPDSILYRVDTMSMANSIEVRVPYLDHRIVEFMFSLPLKYKIRHLQTKYLLRKIMKNKLSPVILRRRKHGFGVPVSRWLKSELKDLYLEYLSKRNVENWGIFNYKYIQHIFKEHLENRADNGRKLWNLLILFMWYDRFRRR